MKAGTDMMASPLFSYPRSRRRRWTRRLSRWLGEWWIAVAVSIGGFAFVTALVLREATGW